MNFEELGLSSFSLEPTDLLWQFIHTLAGCAAFGLTFCLPCDVLAISFYWIF
jgi:hypothetical protein